MKMKTTPCTEDNNYAFTKAPRCGAKARRSNSNSCNSPAVRGKKRCRMHGGAQGSGAKRNNKNALKHGQTTFAAKQLRKKIQKTLKVSKKLLEVTSITSLEQSILNDKL